MKVSRATNILNNHCYNRLFNGIYNNYNDVCQYKRKQKTILFMSITQLSRKTMKSLAINKVSPNQWRAYWGTSKIETLQKILESVLMAYGGAWIGWFLSFMAGSFVSSIIGTILVFNWMYSPWLYAKRMNNSIWSSKGNTLSYAILTGTVTSIKKFRRRTGKTIGGVSHEYFAMVIDDNEGRELEIITNWQEAYHSIKRNMKCSTILVSKDSDFSNIQIVTEVYIPDCDTWVGEYPYLNHNKFIKLNTEIEKRLPDNDKIDMPGYLKIEENIKIPDR